MTWDTSGAVLMGCRTAKWPQLVLPDLQGGRDGGRAAPGESHPLHSRLGCLPSLEGGNSNHQLTEHEGWVGKIFLVLPTPPPGSIATVSTPIVYWYPSNGAGITPHGYSGTRATLRARHKGDSHNHPTG